MKHLFLQGMYSDLIQTTVEGKNNSSSDEVVETDVKGQSAILSNNESYKNCSKLSSKCSSRNKINVFYVIPLC
jgi:hypothetical protein